VRNFQSAQRMPATGSADMSLIAMLLA
jgi:hypothetical protein